MIVRDSIGNELKEGDPLVMQFGGELCIGNIVKLSTIVSPEASSQQDAGHAIVTIVRTLPISSHGIVFGVVAPKNPLKEKVLTPP